MTLQLDEGRTLAEANAIAGRVKGELKAHVPALAVATVSFAGAEATGAAATGHHHAPDPFVVEGRLTQGELAIVDTDAGERMRLVVTRHADGLEATVVIRRPDGNETLVLHPTADDHHSMTSTQAPAEPHEFDATLFLRRGGEEEALPFHMAEPEGHRH